MVDTIRFTFVLIDSRGYPKMVRDILDAALKLEVKGKFMEAARLYQDAGRYDKASFMYHKAGMHDESIEMLILGKQFKKAAEYCAKLERHGKAAELYERAGELERASKAYIDNFQYDRGAAVLERLGKKTDAARFYMKMEQYLKAAEIYEDMGEDDLAVQAYRRLAEERGPEGIKNLGKPEKIAEVFRKAGDTAAAADMYLKTGEDEKALQVCIEGGKIEDAVEIYKNLGKDIGYELINDIPGGEVYRNYADFFKKMGDHPKAAHIYEKHGDYIAAGESYETSDDPHMAAECFFRAENFKRAAEMYEASSRFKTAGDLFYKMKDYRSGARNYEKEGMFYRAGRLYQLVGQNEKAIELLQKIEPHDPDYRKAVKTISKAFREMGYTDLALDRYRELIPETSLDADTVDLFYDYAVTLQESNHPEEAEKILKKIVGFQFSYLDAAKKLKEVQRRIGSEDKKLKQKRKPSEPESPAPSPAEAPAGDVPDLLSAPEVKERLAPPPEVPEKAVKLLKYIQLFRDFEENDLRELWVLGETAVYKENEKIISGGGSESRFFVLVTGKVCLRDEKGNILHTLDEPGDHLGAPSLVEVRPGGYHAVAAKKTRMILFDAAAFLDMIRSDKSRKVAFLKSLNDSLSRRLNELDPAAEEIKNEALEIIKELPSVLV